MSHLILLSVPLFVFLGLLIEMTGMARAMVAFLGNLLGHVRGGLSYVLVGSMYLVSGISGSKAADMAAVAPVLFPEMQRRGAKKGDLVALLSATGAQTETIPPSLVLLTIGSVTGVSIAALFTGGMLPAVVLGLTLCAVVWLRYRNEDLSHVQRASARQIGRSLVIAVPAVALPFVIRAAVVEGVATATEVSTIGIVYSVLAGLLIYRHFEWRRLLPMLVETASLSGAILLIIGAATAMAWSLTQSGFSQDLADAMASLPGGAAGFIAVSIVVFIILGSVLEGIPAIVLFGPLLFPIARQMGVHDVHYAMIVILAMGIGLFAPPFGVGYYAACAVGRVNPDEGIRPDHRLYARSGRRAHRGSGGALDIDRLPEEVMSKGARRPTATQARAFLSFLSCSSRPITGTLHRRSAVDVVDLADDKRSFLRSEECNHGRDLVWLSDTADRRHRDHAIQRGGIELLQLASSQVGHGQARRHRVHPNTGLGEFASQRFGERDDGALRSRISRGAEQATAALTSH